MYLCGTKVDLVEESKKARKVDVHMVREYAEGQWKQSHSTCIPAVNDIHCVCVCVCVCAEISAKYMETSAKTGYNIGKCSSQSHGVAVVVCLPLPCTEQMFMTIAEDFVSHNKTTKPGEPAVSLQGSVQ